MASKIKKLMALKYGDIGCRLCLGNDNIRDVRIFDSSSKMCETTEYHDKFMIGTS